MIRDPSSSPAARWFENTVSALTYSFIRTHGGPAYSPIHNAVARFVLDESRRAPDHLRLALRLATAIFDLSTVPFTGRRFHRLGPERRHRYIAGWASAPLGACRDLIRFYEALVVFGWTSMREDGDA